MKIDDSMSRLMAELHELAQNDPDDPSWLSQRSVSAHSGSRIAYVQQRAAEYILADPAPLTTAEPVTGLTAWMNHNRRS